MLSSEHMDRSSSQKIPGDPLAVQIIPDASPSELLFMCSDDSKPYIRWKARDEVFQDHIGFDIIRARGQKFLTNGDSIFCAAVFFVKLLPVFGFRLSKGLLGEPTNLERARRIRFLAKCFKNNKHFPLSAYLLARNKDFPALLVTGRFFCFLPSKQTLKPFQSTSYSGFVVFCPQNKL